MKKNILIIPLILSLVTSCWKPPIIGGEGIYKIPLIPEKIVARVFYYAHKFVGAGYQIKDDRRIIFEPLVQYKGWDSIMIRQKWLNDEAKKVCDSVLYDQMCNLEFISNVDLAFDIYYENAPPGVKDGQRFVYDLRKYPFK